MIQPRTDKGLRSKVGHIGCKRCSSTWPFNKNAGKFFIKGFCLFHQLKPEKTCKPSRQKCHSPEIAKSEKCPDEAMSPDEAKGVVGEEGR